MLECCAKLSSSHAEFTPFSYELEGRSVRIRQDNTILVFPRPIPPVKLILLVSGYLRWLERKYTLPGFCGIEPGDRVVDCGAYIGGFGLTAIAKAAQVDFFEPDPGNFSCLSTNVGRATMGAAHQAGLHRKAGVLSLNRSESSVEHSFLTPDDGPALEAIEVDILRLDGFAKAQGIEQIVFLKIEAEGVEIEVYQGVGELPIKKIAVDINPERDGESPREYFEQTLTSRGYEVRVRQNVLFARRPEI